MLLSDIREFKRVLEIDPSDTQEDVNLNFYLSYASEIIQEYLGRGDLALQPRTEYYDGTGTRKLPLRSRPVYTTPTIEVYVDTSGFYGAPTDSFNAGQTAKVYGQDFCLQIDQPNGTSRSGILINMRNAWNKQWYRSNGLLSPYIGQSFGTIKVVYSGGWTVDDLPSQIRLACNTIAAQIRYLMPLGVMLSSENYEERAISILNERKDYLTGLAKQMLCTWKTWSW